MRSDRVFLACVKTKLGCLLVRLRCRTHRRELEREVRRGHAARTGARLWGLSVAALCRKARAANIMNSDKRMPNL
jgi:hypothetical protein